MAYATIDELSRAWRSFADYEVPHLTQALEDVGVLIDRYLDECGKTADDVPTDALRVVSCNVVRRSFGELDATNADDQWATLAEPNAVNVTGAVRHTDYYLVKADKVLLGVRCGGCAFAGCS